MSSAPTSFPLERAAGFSRLARGSDPLPFCFKDESLMVYVDDLKPQLPRTRQARRYGTLWCHMVADTLEELHDLAKKIGLKRAYFQGHGRFPHYDLTPNKREQALKAGAGYMSARDWVRKHQEMEAELSRRARKRQIELGPAKILLGPR